ncbi:hypothetical protein Pla52o_39120 [Novipirellula galeiformis]|uniref:Uncharacterized protein n=2 Tax=Novipirellula galeiformis TaxID=2528004 RepID=A0A5C6CCG8_9BACT|nr:hypothetical protein Pla52o_39120 [Novipirellula galeiformis]
MLDVIDLFGEKTTRDELGLGGVRDAFDVACMLASMGGLGNRTR